MAGLVVACVGYVDRGAADRAPLEVLLGRYSVWRAASAPTLDGWEGAIGWGLVPKRGPDWSTLR